MTQIADKATEAAQRQRQRETRQQLDSPALDRGPYDGDPQDLAGQWRARHTEWRPLTALTDGQSRPVCSPERDVQGSTWAQERDAQREAALTRRTRVAERAEGLPR
ncbi:hypothetical protein [Streptomyces sp. NPDC058694]|uniref:hypothetical protein n=1 Tax=Streptomyces sp. NPDC058694 TaxID=3346603 RepID=UPI003667A98F